MNKVLKTLLLGVSLTTITGTAIAMNQYVKPENVVQDDTYLMYLSKSGDSVNVQKLVGERSDQIGKQTKGGVTALMYAAKNGHLDCVKVLMNTIEARMQDESGWTAMMMAATNGHADCVEALKDTTEAGLQNQYGNSALMMIIQSKTLLSDQKMELIKILAGTAEAGKQDQYGNSALMMIISNDTLPPNQKFELIKLLALAVPEELGKQNEDGKTALMIIISDDALTYEQKFELIKILAGTAEAGKQDKNGRTALMNVYSDKKLLLAQKMELIKILAGTAEAGKQDKNGRRTALMMIISNDTLPPNQKFELIKLLAVPEELGKQNEEGKTALMLTLWNCHDNDYSDNSAETLRRQDEFSLALKSVSLLKDAEAGKQDKNGRTALMNVFSDSGLSACQQLKLAETLAGTSEAGKQDKYGNTAMMLAIKGNKITGNDKMVLSPIQKIEVVNLLKGAEAGKQDNNGCTALMVAAQEGCAACVKELKVMANEIDKKNIKSETALMIAADSGSNDCVEELKCIDTGKQSITGSTALMMAATKGYANCVQSLKNTIELKMHNTKILYTALMCAAKNGHADCVKALLGEIGEKDNAGNTALMNAAINMRIDCVKFLLEEVGEKNNVGNTALMLAKETLKKLEDKPIKRNNEVAIKKHQENIDNCKEIVKILEDAQFKQDWPAYMQQRAQTSATDISWIKDQGKTDLLRELAYQTATKKPYDDVFYQDHEKEQYLFIVVRTMLEKAIQENKPMTAENAFEEVGKYLEGIRIIGDVRKPLVEKIQQEIAANGAKEQIIADAKEYIEHTDVLKFCQNQQKKLLGK